MNSTQTTQGDQKTATGTTPFDQVTELEQRENTRIEKEISAMQKEKEEVSQAVAQKEHQAGEELKTTAKQELKEYSEKELKQILESANEEAESECAALEKTASANEEKAVDEIVALAKDPEKLLS